MRLRRNRSKKEKASAGWFGSNLVRAAGGQLGKAMEAAVLYNRGKLKSTGSVDSSFPSAGVSELLREAAEVTAEVTRRLHHPPSQEVYEIRRELLRLARISGTTSPMNASQRRGFAAYGQRLVRRVLVYVEEGLAAVGDDRWVYIVRAQLRTLLDRFSEVTGKGALVSDKPAREYYERLRERLHPTVRR